MSAGSFIAFTALACQAFAGPTTAATKTVPAAATTTTRAAVTKPGEKSSALVPAAMIVPQPAAPLTPLSVVSPSKFCPTEGSVGRSTTNMRVDTGAMRGVLSTDRSSSAEVDFTYRGPSKDTQPLADGEIRRQIGVKLKAQDSCNVIYAMWHIAPDQGIQVLVKRNPGKSTHAQCGDGGYVTPTASVNRPVAPIVAGAPRTLRADLVGQRLRVTADGVLAWEGALPASASEIQGPPGVRSDNGTFDFQVRVPGAASAAPACN